MQWRIHGRRAIYTSDWMNLWMEDVELPNGRRLEHHVLRMPRKSVVTVALDGKGNTLLLWRHRFITDTWGWEVPAGWTDNGEDLIDAARREFEEETGWRADHLSKLCSYFALNGISDQQFTVFKAENVVYVGAPTDASESSMVEWKPLSEIPRMIVDGQIQ